MPLKLHRNTRNKLPDIAFCYYRNACNVAETARRVNLSEGTVHKILNSGMAKEWLDRAEANDAQWVGKEQPFRSLLTRTGTTRGRYFRTIRPKP